MSLVRTRLSVMMFLEFFIWGAWLPLIFAYLPSRGFTSLEQSWVLNTFAIASLIGMFFSNHFADRSFAAERFLACSHAVGGLAFLGLLWAGNFWTFFTCMLVHCLFYVPTISITNSIAFANVADPQKDFGLVRLWGTIGWIAAAWPYVWFPDRTNMFYFAGGASLLLAAFSLLLPHTPPRPAAAGQRSLAWLDAASLLKQPFLLVLFVVTFIDALVHQCYFIWTEMFLQIIDVPKNWTSTVMSVGQIAEIGAMAVLGYCLKRLGWRATMTIGVLGHAVRFTVFAFFPHPVPVIASILLHGVCYAFFFATVYIFVDEYFPKHARSSAQGLFNLLILGVGPFVANFLWPQLGEMVKTADVSAAVINESLLEVMIRGYVNYPATSAFSLEKLTIKEPGKQPYERHIALGTGRQFELTLGKPIPGTYSIGLHIKRRSWLTKERPALLQLPDLVVGNLDLKRLPKVEVKDYDFQRLFLFPSATALAAAILLLVYFRPPPPA